MARLLGVSFLILCGFALGTRYILPDQLDDLFFADCDSTSADKSDRAQARLERSVTRLKRMLPKNCGPGVTWFDVQAGDHEIIYKYRVEADRRVLESRRHVMKRVFSQQKTLMSDLVERDMRMRYDIYDRGGRFVFSDSLSGDPVNSPASVSTSAAQQVSSTTSKHLSSFPSAKAPWMHPQSACGSAANSDSNLPARTPRMIINSFVDP